MTYKNIKLTKYKLNTCPYFITHIIRPGNQKMHMFTPIERNKQLHRNMQIVY